MVDNIEIIAEVYLEPPYDESLNFLISVVSTRGFFILESSTLSQKAKVAIPSKIFKNIMGKNPKIGLEIPIGGTERYIKKIKIVDIKIRREKSDKNTKSK